MSSSRSADLAVPCLRSWLDESVIYICPPPCRDPSIRSPSSPPDSNPSPWHREKPPEEECPATWVTEARDGGIAERGQMVYVPDDRLHNPVSDPGLRDNEEGGQAASTTC